MNCEQAREMLGVRRTTPIRAQHQAGCEDCRQLAALLTLAANVPEAKLPAGFEKRLRARLAEVSRPCRRTWLYALPTTEELMRTEDGGARVGRSTDGRAGGAASGQMGAMTWRA